VPIVGIVVSYFTLFWDDISGAFTRLFLAHRGTLRGLYLSMGDHDSFYYDRVFLDPYLIEYERVTNLL
jgi:hypothetical protein